MNKEEAIAKAIELLTTFTVDGRGNPKRLSVAAIRRITGLSDKAMRKLKRELVNGLEANVYRKRQASTKKDMAGKDMKRSSFTDKQRHAAEMYVLSRVGKCTDGMAELEREVATNLGSKPVYGRNTTCSLAKVKVGFIPNSERN